jgi:TetR/AcrR family transcriptional regulator, transcriptional repressor for nem operon
MVARGQALNLLLDAAEVSILARGLSRTTVDDICRAAGVTKGAFYHHFDTKDALALAALDRYFTRVSTAFAVEPVDDEQAAAYLARILDHAETVAAGPLLQRGCLMAVYALEVAETDEGLREALAERFDGLSAGLQTVLTQVLRDRGCKPAAARREAALLGRQFVVCLEGGIVLAKAHRDEKRIVEAFRFYRDGLEARLR